ncbi:hypothetical protein [Neotamlana sedimentorum]|nr:hypothetical protein [Tamlana sedimentorum]
MNKKLILVIIVCLYVFLCCLTGCKNAGLNQSLVLENNMAIGLIIPS